MRTTPQRANFLALSRETREQKTSTVPVEEEEKPGSRLMIDITKELRACRGSQAEEANHQKFPTIHRSVYISRRKMGFEVGLGPALRATRCI